ncbi:hypothetical protein DXG01_013276 [Tephrocybe rancida]|nr:hypothetical protein DXG01_013276 [Tephrocybe rancida]
MSEPSLKRKQPPSFRHLPINRAKKLKQTWVENQKIKSKWKAQKRKEEISTKSIEDPEQNDEEVELDSGSESEQSEQSEQQDEDKAVEEPEVPTPKKSTLHPSRAHIHPELAPKKRRRRFAESEPPAEPLSLRELTRQAYSRESLHTFKVGDGQRGSSHGRGRGRRGGLSRGRGAPRGETGRGQPNMKLRMDAMLEQIKQSMA